MVISETKKKVWLILSITNNLSLLAAFKYLGPCFDFLNAQLAHFSLSPRFPELDWVLPVGISFYTFQTMSYSIDIYRGSVKPLNKQIDFMLYVSFFPQLVAGPILRAKDFAPQLIKKFEFKPELFYKGLLLIMLGLIKKVSIADPLGVHWVDPVFQNTASASALDISIASLAYALQVFHDFSGYSDIAIGLACCLGYHIPANFDAPYLCSNPADFWNRWHISLSHWVRDYVYYPMCFSKLLQGRLILCSWISMVLIGTWHGASLTFVCFGLYHGTLVVIHRLSQSKLKHISKLYGYSVLAWAFFFSFILYGCIIFRANSMADLSLLSQQLFLGSWSSNLIEPNLFLFFSLLIAFALQSIRDHHILSVSQKFMTMPSILKVACLWSIIVCLWHGEYSVQGQKAFIYFQF